MKLNLNLINYGDFLDVLFKLKSRGYGYFFSRFSLNGRTRVKNNFNSIKTYGANFWSIPDIKETWNKKISGNEDISYEQYITQKYFSGKRQMKMLSIGCGQGSHEPVFAHTGKFSEIKGIDLSDRLIAKAKKNACRQGFENISYETGDIYKYDFPSDYYDLVLFHASLHHFDVLHFLLGKQVYNTLKKNGLLVIFEYVGPNRLQWTKEQLTRANEVLHSEIPECYKTWPDSNHRKNRIYRPGLWRMLLTDPSESINSENILNTIHEYYDTVEEKALGGNIVQLVFKDIAHHFISSSKETSIIVKRVLEIEEEFIEEHRSDLIFGVYKKKMRV